MNIVKLVDANSKNHPDKLALCNMETEFSFKEVRAKSEQAAACFQSKWKSHEIQTQRKY